VQQATMSALSIEAAWDAPLDELNGYLRAAGVEPVTQDIQARSARELDAPARSRLALALRRVVSQARTEAPPVAEWFTASESLLMNDDGSQAARLRADRFWSSLTCIVNGGLALVMLGDLSEFPLFVELLRYQPAGHLAEMATGVLSHYVDPSRELDAQRLTQRAQEWLQANEAHV
jgi:hypothetical protein